MECSIVFSFFWRSHCSLCHPVTTSDRNVPLSFHCFEDPTVLHAIQWSECFIVFSFFWRSHCSPCHPVTTSDRNVPLCVHCLFIVLKIPLCSMPSSHDQWSKFSIVFSLFWRSHCSPCHPVIRMFHCLFILLKISLFLMPSSHSFFWYDFDVHSKTYSYGTSINV
jgi:hypothetical protein